MAPMKILIVGCSIGGPALASFLLMADMPTDQKPHITILERSSSLRDQGQNIDIRGAGITLIKKLGIEETVRANTVDETGVTHVDENDYRWFSVAADRTGKLSTPTADIEILRGKLAAIIYERSRELSALVRKQGGHGIDYIFGDTVKTLDQAGDRVHVEFTKTPTQSFDIVVGSDGLQSQIRRMVWGSEVNNNCMRRLHMYGAFFSIPKGPTDDDWRRYFHKPGRRSVQLRPSSVPDRTSVFMSVINEHDDRLRLAGEKGREGLQEQKQLMAEYFRDAGWECERVVKGMMETEDFYYDPITQIMLDRWSKGRVVLLGDAGYCGSPLSGMGTTLALTGAHNLAGALIQHPNDITAAFEQYETKMRPIVTRAQRLAPGMPYTLNPDTAWGVWFFLRFFYFMNATGLMGFLIRVAGPPANSAAVRVEDYGFRSPEKVDR